MCFSGMCCLRVVCGSFSISSGQNLHVWGGGVLFSSSPEWTALSSLSSPPGFGWVLVGLVWIELFWLDGLEGGLLVGVEVLIGESGSSSVLWEMWESSAKISNLLLPLILFHASNLSSESMALPGPETTKWEL